jgi:hypothetical protein
MPNFDTVTANAKLEADVTTLVDHALAARIAEACETMDLTPSQKVRWIASVIGLRSSLIGECTQQMARRADEPDAPSLASQ